MIDFKEINRLMDVINRASKHEVAQFLVQHEIEILEQMREKNLRDLLAIAKSHGVKYIYIGKYEIAGNERVRAGNRFNSPPAMWEIAKEMGFPGSCGNSDQYQCLNAEIAFPEDAFFAWDLEMNCKIPDEVAKNMNFYLVVERKRYHSWR